MSQKSRLTFLLMFSLKVIGLSQIVFSDSRPYSGEKEAQALFNEGLKVVDQFRMQQFNILRADILEIDQRKYLTIDGRFDLFEWDGFSWQNVYHGNHYGYNYSSKKFVYNKEIYSYGGYGFWRAHGDLLKFIFEHGQWELVDNSSPNHSISFVEGQTLNFYRDGKVKSGIDLKKLVVNNYSDKSPISTKSRTHSNIETTGYVVITSQPMKLIDKANREVLESSLGSFQGLKKAINDQYQFHIKGDSIEVWSDSMKQIVYSYDLATERMNFAPLNRAYSTIHIGYWFGGIILLLIFGFLIKLQSHKIPQRQVNDPISLSFESLSGRTISVDELDDVLKIGNVLPIESRRFKRHKLLSQINQDYSLLNGKPLITRIKDPSDKRKFIYQVS